MQLLMRYCVQCHHLPSPGMHDPEKLRRVIDRMVLRMKGRGNMGALMKDMMVGVDAPSEEETHAPRDDLTSHAQQPIQSRRYPDLAAG